MPHIVVKNNSTIKIDNFIPDFKISKTFNIRKPVKDYYHPMENYCKSCKAKYYRRRYACICGELKVLRLPLVVGKGIFKWWY